MRSRLTLILILLTTLLSARGQTCGPMEIMGDPIVEAEYLTSFVRRHNPTFEPEIAEAFINQGRLYGIRGDIALCQAIVETGWFRFADGTRVRPEQHNYCGLGVVDSSAQGASFETVEEGVEAMMQHLYAYSTRQALPTGRTLLDPRFGLVNRGCARTWHDLAGRWAMNAEYGNIIMRVYSDLLRHAGKEIPTENDETLPSEAEGGESEEISLPGFF